LAKDGTPVTISPVMISEGISTVQGRKSDRFFWEIDQQFSKEVRESHKADSGW
jgi:hypothetical protein